MAVLSSVSLPLSIYVNQSVRNQRREQQADFNEQICEAVLNAAASGAQALVDVLQADYMRRGIDTAPLETLGKLYVARARQLVLEDLTACPRPTRAGPQLPKP